MQHFLRMPQFSAEPRLFSNHIINPLMDPAGPRPGAVQALSQVMQSVMIRHRCVALLDVHGYRGLISRLCRIEDVESDIQLPSLCHETVLLNLGSLETQTYNVLQAVIAINAVDSERVDQVHPFQ